MEKEEILAKLQKSIEWHAQFSRPSGVDNVASLLAAFESVEQDTDLSDKPALRDLVERVLAEVL